MAVKHHVIQKTVRQSVAESDVLGQCPPAQLRIHFNIRIFEHKIKETVPPRGVKVDVLFFLTGQNDLCPCRHEGIGIILREIAFDFHSACGINVVFRLAVGLEAAAYRNIVIRIIHDKVRIAPVKFGDLTFVIGKILADYVVPADEHAAAVYIDRPSLLDQTAADFKSAFIQPENRIVIIDIPDLHVTIDCHGVAVKPHVIKETVGQSIVKSDVLGQ